MRKENFLLLLLAITVFFILFYPSFGWKFRAFLAPVGQISDSKNLLLENESLKSELAKLGAMKSERFSVQGNLLQAFVYSSYPLNFKNRILISAGKNNGVKTGQPVFVRSSALPAMNEPKSVLIGKIAETFPDYSIAETIFDSGLQMSVRIGNAGTNSLLKGGNVPRLTLIPKDAKIGDGDSVYSTSQDYPFGMPLGLVKNIRLSSDGFFDEADLETAYNPNDFQVVFVDINYAR